MNIPHMHTRGTKTFKSAATYSWTAVEMPVKPGKSKKSRIEVWLYRIA
jgi:hypothetical protein